MTAENKDFFEALSMLEHERGMNQSAIHEDVMIGAEDSEITGKCRDGRTVTLFQNGVWAL